MLKFETKHHTNYDENFNNEHIFCEGLIASKKCILYRGTLEKWISRDKLFLEYDARKQKQLFLSFKSISLMNQPGPNALWARISRKVSVLIEKNLIKKNFQFSIKYRIIVS